MPADTIEELLDFETPIETMFAHLFAENQISVYAPANGAFVTAEWQEANTPGVAEYIFNNEEEFQKRRPRVELIVNAGAATGHMFDPVGSTSMKDRRTDAHEGTVMIGVISKPNILEHRAFVARVRKLMGDDWTTLMTTHMPYHAISRCMETGTSHEYAPQDGLFRTTLTYETHFSIGSDAWPAD